MSLWYTLKNIFHTPEPPRTDYTMCKIWHEGSWDHYVFEMSPPQRAVDMLQANEPSLRVEIWRHYEQPSTIGSGSMAPSRVSRMLCSLRNQNQGNAGSPDPKPQGFSGQLDELNTSRGLY